MERSQLETEEFDPCEALHYIGARQLSPRNKTTAGSFFRSTSLRQIAPRKSRENILLHATWPCSSCCEQDIASLKVVRYKVVVNVDALLPLRAKAKGFNYSKGHQGAGHDTSVQQLNA